MGAVQNIDGGCFEANALFKLLKEYSGRLCLFVYPRSSSGGHHNKVILRHLLQISAIAYRVLFF